MPAPDGFFSWRTEIAIQGILPLSFLRKHGAIPKVFQLLTLAIALLFYLGADLHACQICLPYPTRSVADDLIEAEHVVLCREDPEKPFTLKILEVRKGGTPSNPLDLFLDSSTRRLLANDPERSIVCVSSVEPGSPPWKRIATLTPELEPILQHILQHAEIWQTEPEKRATYFSQFLDHSNRQLSSLAHLEVARAPYDIIKEVADAVPPERIRKFLGNVRMMEWHALYILLLAQSDELRDQERIRESAVSHAKYSLQIQTAAWATAYIEIAKDEALDFYDERYLQNPSRTDEERAAIVAAYSVHGTNGHTELRPRIVESFKTLANSHPKTVAAMIPSLIEWQNDALVPQVSSLLTEQPESFEIEQTITLRNYLRNFNQSSTTPPPTSEAPNRMLIYLLGGLLLLPIAIKLFGLRQAAA